MRAAGHSVGSDVETICLSLGANLGDREVTIARAIKLMAAGGVRLLAVSGMYATEPVGYRDQPEFINCAATVATDLEPHALLSRLRAIERVLGRRARAKWHEREIDIDIVLFGERIVDTPDLVIPHPQMSSRAFVLAPLAEIAPNARNPVLGATVEQLLAACDDRSGVRRLTSPVP